MQVLACIHQWCWISVNSSTIRHINLLSRLPIQWWWQVGNSFEVQAFSGYLHKIGARSNFDIPVNSSLERTECSTWGQLSMLTRANYMQLWLHAHEFSNTGRQVELQRSSESNTIKSFLVTLPNNYDQLQVLFASFSTSFDYYTHGRPPSWHQSYRTVLIPGQTMKQCNHTNIHIYNPTWD